MSTAGMSIRDRIGVDVGRRARIEDGIEAAIKNGVRFLDVKIDVAPNAIESLTPERIAGIRKSCEANGIRIGVHTLSAVNVAEVAPHVRDGVDRYLFGHMDACKRLGGEWIVVHAGFHFTSDYEMRRDAGLERLKRLADYGEKIGLPVLLENMNKEPEDAEVKYLAFNLEECQYYFSKLDSPYLRWSFTCNHAHLVPEGIDGFLDGLDLKRCEEVRVADCWGTKEEHLKPGQGNIDFVAMFARLEKMGYRGHFTTAFGSLQDMIEGREYLAREAHKAGLA
jgi:sugar phosphate isomerase/epimerase